MKPSIGSGYDSLMHSRVKRKYGHQIDEPRESASVSVVATVAFVGFVGFLLVGLPRIAGWL
jgi:hypothetical protein